jgi:uncharacterized protein YkwD
MAHNKPLWVVGAAVLGGIVAVGLVLAGLKGVQAGTSLSGSAGRAGPWQAVFSDTFETGIGAGWLMTDTSGSGDGEYFWAATNVTASQGLTSVWATGGGADGSLLVPGSDDYPNLAASLMVYGPINLSGTTAVSLTLDYWLETEADFDTFETLASTDGTTFTTYQQLSGDSAGWQSQSLALSSLAGAPQAWIGLRFTSNEANNARGVFADNVFLWVQRPLPGTIFLPLAHNPPPTPTPVPTPAPQPGWLAYLNQFRSLATVNPLIENATWSNGDWLHGRYMVKNDYVGHSEDPANPWYTAEGLAAAQNGNVFVSSWAAAPDTVPIDFWMSAPFHAIAMIDPELAATGFGSYHETLGLWQTGSTLDVSRGRGSLPPGTTFPILYPRNGGQSWLRQYSGGEFPDPLTSCPGYTAPTGAPIMVQLGSGNVTPNVTAFSLSSGGAPLASCSFDETNYIHPNPATQNSGRIILNNRDAVVIIPRQPLVAGQSYSVSLTVNSQTISWGFTVIAPPAGQPQYPEAMQFAIR